MQISNHEPGNDGAQISFPFVFGVNHESANFEIREKLAFSRDEIPQALNRLQNSGVTNESVILSTCNRTEIYCLTHDIDFVINAICDIKNICPRQLQKHSYIYSGIDCARHLFRVSSGLESMIFGETEIVAQVKDAVSLATENGSIATNLAGLFQIALSVEKEVRQMADVNTTSSVGGTIVNIINEMFPHTQDLRIVFLGAGTMMASLLPHFKDLAAQEKIVINRTLAKAQNLAESINGKAVALTDLSNVINDCDVIIACCAGGLFLTPESFGSGLQQDKPLLCIDLSMPLVTDATVRQHKNVTFFTLDNIATQIDTTLGARKNSTVLADTIIQDGITQYQTWLKKREVTPLIRALRDNADVIRQEALVQAQKQLNNGEDAQDVLQDFSVKLMNKLLHGPTVNLARTEHKLQDDLADLVSYLYSLNLVK